MRIFGAGRVVARSRPPPKLRSDRGRFVSHVVSNDLDCSIRARAWHRVRSRAFWTCEDPFVRTGAFRAPALLNRRSDPRAGRPWPRSPRSADRAILRIRVTCAAGYNPARARQHVLEREAELWKQNIGRRRSAETIQAKHIAPITDETMPAL